MDNKISFAKLVDWVDGRLSSEEEAAVTAYLSTAGADVQATAEWLQQFRQLSQSLQLAEPPAELRDALRDQFTAYVDNVDHDPFRRFIATLSFDSYEETAVAGIRSAALDVERQYVYTTDFADIVLTLRQAQPAHTLTLDGQIFPLESIPLTGTTVQLVQQHQEKAIATSNDLGEFNFHAFSPGIYDIICSSDTLEISLPAVELRI